MSASPDDLIGRTLDGRYRVESVAARGGMATIYLAIDLRLQRPVAIKVMHSSFAEDANFITRFEREARAAASLTHPNVVSVHDQGRDAVTGAMYLVMELVAGYTVRDVLVERGALSAIQSLAVLDPVLQALDAAHHAGFVHRDIKPENVMIADDGRVRVTDFGLARAIVDTDSTALTKGVLIGTVAYLAPEQVENGAADERSDIYSAGILLYEMLTGNVPFSGDTPIAVAFKHVHANMPMPSEHKAGLSQLLDVIFAKATNRDPAKRYQSAEAFLNDVRRVREIIEGKAPASSFTLEVPAAEETVAEVTTEVDTHQTLVIPIEEARRVSFGGIETTVTATEAVTSEIVDEVTPRKFPTKRAIKLGILLALVAALGFAGLTFANRVTVPQLVGKQVDQAIADLKKVELNGVVSEQVFNDITEAGTVLSADPKSGEGISKGSDVHLVVSKGPERFAVPSLVGLTKADAMVALTSANLKTGTTSEAYNSDVPAGTVISSDPVTGDKLKAGSSVNLLISRGPKPITIPSVKGMTYTRAFNTLRTKGFTNITQTTAHSNKIAKGVVISMTPTAGTSGFSDTAITLTVSSGPPPISVPSVTGYSQKTATKRIINSGLKAQVIISKCKTGKPKSSLINEQSPKAGAEVAKGTTVKLWGVYICG